MGAGDSTARGGKTPNAPDGAYGEVSSCSGLGLQRSRAGCSPRVCGCAEGPGAAAVPGELIHTHPPVQTDTNQLKPAEASINEMEVVRVGTVPPEKTSRPHLSRHQGGLSLVAASFPAGGGDTSRESHGFPPITVCWRWGAVSYCFLHQAILSCLFPLAGECSKGLFLLFLFARDISPFPVSPRPRRLLPTPQPGGLNGEPSLGAHLHQG